ncbi:MULTISPECIES: 50S ribosomal protein L25/general stress protein Ctc [unclassified Guyparkeria]|uniref:50S ribosomal protein L25/general stress protein Ctc n=1 Tax=unclassified Guyparkeria TaxID=2626246 RepID=UPI0007335738|nr:MULTISPECIES: 50S ribosomal protein L25/general stress protein Ctc [unclassified Guyparkeria]KTG17762.1 50S ribosomal protein L25 [Guyparkeria sp. XI15]OAE89473.1 50S ribosomal protein L25/general stress protein Ctc [Guyparkeria sp. WRN-7]
MSKETFKIEASVRDDLGKGASRRLRREGNVPAIVYGGKKAPVSLTINHNELLKHLDHEAFFSHILELNVDGETDEVVLRDLHRHPYKNTVVLHADFQRITRGQKMRMNVPLHFENREESKGAKAGGVVSVIHNEVEIECLPRQLPEYLTIDLADLDVNESIHLSEIKLPEGISIPELALGEEHDVAVVAIHPPKVEKEEEPEEAEEPEAAGGEEEKGEEES